MENANKYPFKPPANYPEPLKGTTILALKYKDGVVVAADKRASAGYTVASANTQKLYHLGKKTVVTTAGGVADNQQVVKIMNAEINLFELERGREMESSLIANLTTSLLYNQYRRTGFPYFAWLVMAGFDSKGPHVYNIEASGSILEENYTSNGSGSPFALGVLEAMYDKDMAEDKATEVALLALRSAILKDIATGDGIDCVVINKDGIKTLTKEEVKGILGPKYPFAS